MTTRSTPFASVVTPTAATGTVKFGTVLSPGETASYPSSLFSVVSVSSAAADDGNASSSSLKGLSSGAIAGIAVGAVAGVALIAGLVLFFLLRRRRAKSGHAKRDSQQALLRGPPASIQTPATSTFAGGAARGSTHPGDPFAQPSSATSSPASNYGTSNYGSSNYGTTTPATISEAGESVAVPPLMATPPRGVFNKQGLAYGRTVSGHRRIESTDSTQPLFGQRAPSSVGDSESPDRDSVRFSHDLHNRPSMETFYNGTPRAPAPARFD